MFVHKLLQFVYPVNQDLTCNIVYLNVTNFEIILMYNVDSIIINHVTTLEMANV